MISASKWHKLVPKDFAANVQFRIDLYKACAGNADLRAGILEICKKDILFFVNAFVYTFDPRLPNAKEIPFITYPFQDEALLTLQEAIEVGEDQLIQKSRCMGASWMLVLIFVYFCIFRDNCKFLMMSRNADLVDSDDADSLFWKLDFIHKYLPTWMLNPEIDVYRVKSKMKVNYLKTGGQITGSTTTKTSSIGGRATAVGVDEYSRYDPVVAKLLKAGLRPVTNCCLWNFTVNPEMGKSHPSYELVQQAAKGELRDLRMHWLEHPVYRNGHYRVDKLTGDVEVIDKTYDFGKYNFQRDRVFINHSPWFDKERIRVGNDRDMKELYEIDYEGSGFTFFDELMISDYLIQNAKPPIIEGDLTFDPLTGDHGAFVRQQGGRVKLWTELDRFGKPPSSYYTGGADISLGVGLTPSCLSIGDLMTGEKVLEFVSAEMKPDLFAAFCVAVCRWFSSPMKQTYLAWEKVGPGQTFGVKVLEFGYTSVYTPPVGEGKWSKLIASSPGWVPNRENLRHLLLTYQTGLSTRSFLNRSKTGLKQCMDWMQTPKGPKARSTMNKSDDPSGASENHGDLVISDALCYKMMVERGGGAQKKVKESEPPVGSIAWHRKDEELAIARNEELYPDWDGRRLW